MAHGGVVEVLDVVEEVAGEGGVGGDGGAGEAEVAVVVSDFFVDLGSGGDGDAGSGEWEGHGLALGGFTAVEAAVEVFGECGGEDVLVFRDELDADVVEVEGGVAVVGDDDADGEEAVTDVGVAEEGAGFELVAGVGGDGDVLFFVGLEEGVLGGGFGGGEFFVGGVGLRMVRARAASDG